MFAHLVEIVEEFWSHTSWWLSRIWFGSWCSYLVPLAYKVTLVLQALRLCTGRTVHRGSRGIALHFLDHGTRRGWGVSVTPRPLFTPGRDPVPNVQEGGWALGPVWTGAENLAPTGIRSPDRPARSQSLYRLSYPATGIYFIRQIKPFTQFLLLTTENLPFFVVA